MMRLNLRFAARRWVGLFALAGLAACGASPPQVKGPARTELKHLSLWIGDWTLKGTAKDTPTGPEYKLDWRLHGRWVLNGHFVQIDHIWKGLGPEILNLEIMSHDLARKVDVSHGFGSDGSSWASSLTTVNATTVVETGTFTMPDGKAQTFRVTWVVSPDGLSLSAKQDSEMDGVKFIGYTVTGTRTRP